MSEVLRETINYLKKHDFDVVPAQECRSGTRKVNNDIKTSKTAM